MRQCNLTKGDESAFFILNLDWVFVRNWVLRYINENVLCAFPPLEADLYTGLSHPLKHNVFYDFCCCAIGWSCLIHPDIIVLPTSVSLWRCKMVEFNTDFLFLTKPFVLVTMGDALLSWEFTTTVVVPLLAFLRFLPVSCFNPLHNIHNIT